MKAGRVFYLIIVLGMLSCYAQGQCISAFPSTEDFELNNGNWTSGGTANDWAWGSPAKNFISSAGSGNNCWITGGLTGNSYNVSERSFIESPCYDLTSLNTPYVEFLIYWETEYQYDGANLQYSLNNGNSWTNVGNASPSTDCRNRNWYNTPAVTNLNGFVSNTNGWTGTTLSSSGSCLGGNGSGSWLTASQVMTYLANQSNVKFRFTFGAGQACNSYNGFAIDLFTIKEAPQQFTIDATTTPDGCASTGGTVQLNTNGGVAPFVFSTSGVSYLNGFADSLNAGNYAVVATDALGCLSNVSYSITSLPALAVNIDFISDTCYAGRGFASASISSGSPPYSYAWSNGSFASYAQNLVAGNYDVSVTDSAGCVFDQSFAVDNYSDFVLELDSVYTTCDGSSIKLKLVNDYSAYLWSDGDTSGNKVIDEEGIYWLAVQNNNGCIAADTFSVLIDCINDVLVPKAFTPNGDGINDFFFAQGISVSEFEMEIYNRWGQKIFVTDDINKFWNGNIENSPAEEAIYVYRISFTNFEDVTNEKFGSFMLVR